MEEELPKYDEPVCVDKLIPGDGDKEGALISDPAETEEKLGDRGERDWIDGDIDEDNPFELVLVGNGDGCSGVVFLVASSLNVKSCTEIYIELMALSEDMTLSFF